MRASILLIAICAVCVAQSAEDAVVSVLKQMEKAEQTGNGEAWFSLWASKSDMASHPEIKAMARANPSVRYEASKVLVDGNRAAAAVSMNQQFLSMRFVLENGAWKILDEHFSNVPIDPASLYALIPPPDGSFARSGSPWDRVAAAPGLKKWKLRATSDESYVYVRIETEQSLPAPGTALSGSFPNVSTGVDRVWPHMKLRAGATELSLMAEDRTMDHATFDATGKANSHRYTLTYALTLWRGNHVLFEAAEEPLIAVRDRSIDLRIPLKSLGVEPRGKITIADANVPGQFAAYDVKPF